LRAGGSGSWVFQYRIGSKQRRITFGSINSIPAARAREQAVRFYAAVKLGRDPAGEKTADQRLVNETVGAVLPAFLARQNDRLRSRSFIEVERHLMLHAKRLHGLPMAKVTRRDIAAVLSAIAASKSGATANRVRASLSSFFSWMIREGLIDQHPVAWTERSEETSRARVLSDDELRSIWLALKDDTYGAIVRLLILTGCRREEIGALKWSEVNLDEAIISLPSERTKNKNPHEVPLTQAAVAILKEQPRRTLPDGSACEFVFARVPRGFSDWAGGKADLDQRIIAARKENAKQQSRANAQIVPWVLHDFRRTLSTLMHERLGIQPHIVEACLGHSGGHRRGIAGVYNRSGYRAEKRRALEVWADHVLALVEGRKSGKVVPLRAAGLA